MNAPTLESELATAETFLLHLEREEKRDDFLSSIDEQRKRITEEYVVKLRDLIKTQEQEHTK